MHIPRLRACIRTHSSASQLLFRAQSKQTHVLGAVQHLDKITSIELGPLVLVGHLVVGLADGIAHILPIRRTERKANVKHARIVNGPRIFIRVLILSQTINI